MLQLFAFPLLNHFFYFNLLSVYLNVLVEFFIFSHLFQLLFSFWYWFRIFFRRFRRFLFFFARTTSFFKLKIDFLCIVWVYGVFTITIGQVFWSSSIVQIKVGFRLLFICFHATHRAFLFVQHNCALNIEILVT